MKLIAITLPHMFCGESDAVASLLESGYDWLHVRKPHASKQEMISFLESIPAQYLNRIVLHDHFELAESFAVRGIHLNSRCDKPPVNFRGTISRSCHSLDEIVQYKSRCHYLFLGPLFDSLSKQGYKSNFSQQQIVEASNAGIIDSKVFALGGVTHEKLPDLQAMGFGGAAMVGAAWRSVLTPPVVLTIAGSDSSGGAGVQADIKTISALGAFATSAITALTAQNTQGVFAIQPVENSMVSAQIDAVVSDIDVAAVKVGMVYDASTASAIATAIHRHKIRHLVCDPVMIATSGAKLMCDDTIHAVETELFAHSTIITPNLHEAEMLANCTIQTIDDMCRVATSLSRRYGCSVLVKGGHLDGNSMCDILCHNNSVYQYASPRIDSRNLHGTGCTLSSAIATFLAFGHSVPDAVAKAKKYVYQAIAAAAGIAVGHQHGPLWHFFKDESSLKLPFPAAPVPLPDNV